MTTAQKLARVGLLLSLACGVRLAIFASQALRATRVSSCRVYDLHGSTLELTTATNATVVLSPMYYRSHDQCLPQGTAIEKRSWELGYRINGELVPMDPGSRWALQVVASVGVLMIVFSYLARARSRP